MLDDDECPVLAICVRRCKDCHAALAAFAFSDSEAALEALPDLYAQLSIPIFAFMQKDETLKRARIVVFEETQEEFLLTPKEFGELAWTYIDQHVCARWN